MSEEVVARVNEVRLYFGEKPPAVGLPKGGQLVLTNRRLVFIKGLYGPVDLDWGLKIEGSFMIPLSDIIEAKAERSFLRLRYRLPVGRRKPARSYSSPSFPAQSRWGLSLVCRESLWAGFSERRA